MLRDLFIHNLLIYLFDKIFINFKLPLITYKLATFSQIWFLTILLIYLFIVKKVVLMKTNEYFIVLLFSF